MRTLFLSLKIVTLRLQSLCLYNTVTYITGALIIILIKQQRDTPFNLRGHILAERVMQLATHQSG